MKIEKLALPTSHFPLLTSYMNASRQLHPGFQFCGSPDKGILQVPEELVSYLLSCLRGEPVLPPDVSSEEWINLLSALNPHWIIPLLYWQIGKTAPEFHPPETIRAYMRQTFLRSRVRAFQLEKQLAELLAAFKQEEIPILLLKGPALARSVYPDPATRPASDIDVLVIPEHIAQSRSVLENLGYDCQEKRFEVSRDYYCDEKFFHRKKTEEYRMVELHWDLHRFSGIRREAGIEELFSNAITITSPSLKFEALHPVDALLHRAMSNAFIHDHDMRLSWIYDVVFLSRSLKVPEDWNILLEKSVKWRARLALEYSLKLAQIWGGLRLPPEYEDFSAWPQPAKIEQDAWFNATRRHENLSDYMKLHLSETSVFSEKIKFFIHLLFPSPDYMRMKYPPAKDGLLLFSYLRRWQYWLGKLIF